jgi:hypothetical protein
MRMHGGAQAAMIAEVPDLPPAVGLRFLLTALLTPVLNQ